jgi:hypothetical protein
VTSNSLLRSAHPAHDLLSQVRASFNDIRGAHAAAPYGLCAELIMLKPFFTKSYLPLSVILSQNH